MDQADVEHFERLLNAVKLRHDAAQGLAAGGLYDRARHELDTLHALLDADSLRTNSRERTHANS